MEKRKVPAVRFKGFEDDWEQRKLGDCFTERVESMPGGELISVTINEGIKKFSELGRHDNSNDDKSKYKKVCVGDIAYNSMRMWQGASGYSPYEGIVSPAYTVLSPNSGINSKCLAYQFKLPEMIHIFQINSQGITSDNWNLKYPALSEIEIFVSKDEEEQVKIAGYFTKLDHLITLHQRKLEKLYTVKKSMLEKMFPKNGSKIPEIRFEGFTDDWEQRKLKDLSDFITKGATPTTYGFEWQASGIPFFRNDAIKDNQFIYGDFSYISEDANEVLQRSEIHADDILVAITGDIGKVGIVPKNLEKGNINQHTARIRIVKDAIPYFVYQSLITEVHQKRYQIIKTGLSMPQLSLEQIRENVVLCPSLSEQHKIGLYFERLDLLITLHQRKLEKMKNIKKSLLEKMFI